MAQALDGDRVRAELIDAVSSGDHHRLAELCRTHQATIQRYYPVWTTVPAEVRADPASVQRYAGALIAVAQYFATQLGDPTLLGALSRPDESNPLVAWQRALGQAQELMGELRYDQA